MPTGGRGGRGGGSRGGSSRGRGKARKPRGGRRVASIEEVMARNAELEKKDRNEEDSEEEEDNEEEEDDEEEEDEEEEEEEENTLPLIETFNPNRNRPDVEKTGVVELSRRQKEELAKQQEKIHYENLRAQGKTHQAKADLARLAAVRSRREAAAKQREEENKAKEADLNAKINSKTAIKASHK